MRKQQTRMSPYPGQQPNSKEMQLWQQHLMYKQLQELQRQQQLQQPDLGAWQQNFLSQAAARQAAANQLPSLLNGIAINDASRYMLPNDIIGGEPKTPSSSPMFMADDTNWTQSRGSTGTHGSNRLTVTNDHVHAMRPAGFIPEQLDQSLYGIPISSSRGLLNQFPQFQGMPNNLTDGMAKAVRDQLEKASAHTVPSNSIWKDQCVPEHACLQDGPSVVAQGLEGKRSLGNASVQSLSGGATSGSFQQVYNPQRCYQVQVFQNGQEQGCWSRNLEKKETTQVGPPRGVTSLDPTEEKILFGADDDGNWSATLGRVNNMGIGGYLHEDSFEGSDQFGALPSLQSGSWSALMQEAVQSSSSDKGVQEEWSGLSFQKVEQSSGNPSTMHNDNVKHQFTWDNRSNNFQNASSVRLNPSPFFNDASSGTPLSSAASFLHSTVTAYEENNRVPNDALHKSFQQPLKDDGDMHFDQSHKQKHGLDGGLQAQIQSTDVSCGIWSSVKSAESGNLEFNPQNNQDTWTQQERTPLSNTNRQPNTHPSAWIKSRATHDGSTSHGPDNNQMFHAHDGGNMSRGMEPMISDISSSHNQSVAFPRSSFGAVANSNTLNVSRQMNQYALNSYEVDLGKHSAFDSFVKSRGENAEEYKHQSSKGHQVQDSSVNSTDPSPSMSDSQTSSGVSGWKSVGFRRFQSHPTESLGMDMELADSPKDVGYSQSMPKLVIQSSKCQEQRYMENSRFAGHGVSNIGKAHSTGMQRSSNSPEDSQCRSSNRQTSQNMLELLHKVDSSRDSSSAACFGNSDPSSVHDTHEAGAAHGSTLYPRHHRSPAFPGFGLQLPSPPQRRQLPNHNLHSQTSLHDSSRRQLDPDAGDRDHLQSASTDSGHSLHNALEASHRGNIEGRSDSGQKFKEMSQLIVQGNSSAVTASNLSYMGHQLHQQFLQHHHISSLTGHEAMNQSGNITPGSQADVDEHIKHVSLLRRAQISHDVVSAGQSSQTSLPSIAGRILPFRLDSSADARGPDSQIISADTGHSQPKNDGLHNLSSAPQQHPLAETRSFLEACARSGISQQIDFSTMLQNVWTNASAQQAMPTAYPPKLIPNIPQYTIVPSSGGEKSSGALQMDDNRGNRGGIAPSELATCSSNSQQCKDADKNPAEEDHLQGADSERGDDTPRIGSASEGQDQLPKQHSARDSAVSVSSLGHLPHDVNMRTQWPNATASNSDVEHYGLPVLLTKTQHPNYSLLHQMQAMRGADSDVSRRDGKRLKGEYGLDTSHREWQAGQGYNHGQNAVCRVPLAHELGTSSNCAFPSDVKMLSFSSKESEEESADGTALSAGIEMPSRNICLPGQPDLQNQRQHHSSSSHFIGRNEHPLLTPQVARSWFEQYRKYKNGQILKMYADQKSAKASSQQYLSGEVSARIDNTVLTEQRIETNQLGALSHSVSATGRADNESCHELRYGVTGHDMVISSKKRKTATSDLPPWHQVVSLGGVQRFQCISTAECDWAQPASRLTEKVEYAAEMIEDGSWIPQARRRLMLTTQLMQQLIHSIPTPILAAEVTSSHESVIYFLAKSALGDACGQISCSGCDHVEYPEKENRTCGNSTTSEKESEVFPFKVVGDFVGRSQKLETEFLRLDKRTSILDVRLEWQEVEKFSLINRLGKFHGRSQGDGSESSSTSQNTTRKNFPQRYVTAFSLPGNVPEGFISSLFFYTKHLYSVSPFMGSKCKLAKKRSEDMGFPIAACNRLFFKRFFLSPSSLAADP